MTSIAEINKKLAATRDQKFRKRSEAQLEASNSKSSKMKHWQLNNASNEYKIKRANHLSKQSVKRLQKVEKPVEIKEPNKDWKQFNSLSIAYRYYKDLYGVNFPHIHTGISRRLDENGEFTMKQGQLKDWQFRRIINNSGVKQDA